MAFDRQLDEIERQQELERQQDKVVYQAYLQQQEEKREIQLRQFKEATRIKISQMQEAKAQEPPRRNFVIFKQSNPLQICISRLIHYKSLLL